MRWEVAGEGCERESDLESGSGEGSGLGEGSAGLFCLRLASVFEKGADGEQRQDGVEKR